MQTPLTRWAFTLIELLVVIAIIALLIGILLPTLASARRSAEATKAMASCRSLMQAHALYATDFSGAAIPGFTSYDDPSLRSVRDEFGEPITSSLVSSRWAYRLGPYFDHEWAGTTHVGARADVLEERFDRIASEGMFGWTYDVTVFPSFGLNYRYVGGDFRNDSLIARGDHIERLAQARRPSSLVTFASARFDNGVSRHDGHLIISPPMLETTYDHDADTRGLNTAFGYLHARYHRKVIVGWLDGHVDLNEPDPLIDRRQWANPAVDAGDPDWAPD